MLNHAEKTSKNEKELTLAPLKIKLVWIKLFVLSVVNLLGLYGLALMLTIRPKFYTYLFTYFWYIFGGLGITAGAHRLWSHRSYKAKWPLRLFLMITNSATYQSDVITWARDHRSHHKFCDTDADPYNSKRGFFFAHMGWLCIKKHPDVITKGNTLDHSDLYADPILRFQRKYYFLLSLTTCWVVPTVIPIYFWNESFKCSFFLNAFRLCWVSHGTFLVNSAAHFYGNKPYDQDISPRENRIVSHIALGEGWHNYHHAFPWDYKAAELGRYDLNFSCAFIDAMAKVGLAYGLKTTSDDMIKKKINRTGDGTHRPTSFKLRN